MSRLLKEPEVDTYGGRFATRLRKLRIAEGLSAEEVAASLEITVRTVYHWENGHSEPKMESLAALAKLYNLKSPRQLLPEK
jgi:transcriptional regulator with XRE-family HTH domain